jgi:hypothetical protein
MRVLQSLSWIFRSYFRIKSNNALQWAQQNLTLHQLGFPNSGFPGCCRVPASHEEGLIRAAEWPAVSAIYSIPIPPNIRVILDSVPIQLNSVTGTWNRHAGTLRTPSWKSHSQSGQSTTSYPSLRAVSIKSGSNKSSPSPARVIPAGKRSCEFYPSDTTCAKQPASRFSDPGPSTAHSDTRKFLRTRSQALSVRFAAHPMEAPSISTSSVRSSGYFADDSSEESDSTLVVTDLCSKSCAEEEEAKPAYEMVENPNMSACIVMYELCLLTKRSSSGCNQDGRPNYSRICRYGSRSTSDSTLCSLYVIAFDLVFATKYLHIHSRGPISQ